MWLRVNKLPTVSHIPGQTNHSLYLTFVSDHPHSFLHQLLALRSAMVRLLTVVLLALSFTSELFVNASLQHDARSNNLDVHKRLIHQRSPAPPSLTSKTKIRRSKGGKRCRAVESSSAQETSPAETPKATQSHDSSGGSSSGAKGLISVKSSCGNIGATSTYL